jgi:hypothetical protein
MYTGRELCYLDVSECILKKIKYLKRECGRMRGELEMDHPECCDLYFINKQDVLGRINCMDD